jgi:phosphate transport system substrate-binding protein
MGIFAFAANGFILYLILVFVLLSGSTLKLFFVSAFMVFPLYPAWRMGQNFARKNAFPPTFIARYGPVLAPTIFFLAWVIYLHYSWNNLDASDGVTLLLLEFFFFSNAPFVLGFYAACRDRPDKKLVSRRGLTTTLTLIAVLLAVIFWQMKLDADNTLTSPYDGATVIDDVGLSAYTPGSGKRLAKLDSPAALRLSENYPKLDGATAFYPIYAAVANEVYLEPAPYLTCSRTHEAYNRLFQGRADIIFVLQPSEAQRLAAQNAGLDLRLTPVAKEAFVFFVSERNPVSDLSIEQVQNIYLKKITNWQEVGGENIRILPFQRPVNSGSQTAMIEEVMRDKTLPLPLRSEYYGSMGGVNRGVALYRDYAESIGYSFRFFTKEMMKYIPNYEGKLRGLRPVPGGVKLLSLGGVAPTEDNIRSGSYPFTVDVYAATAGTRNPHVQEMIDWILSPQGQELIERAGYVGIR